MMITYESFDVSAGGGGQTTITLTTLIFRPSLSSLLDTEPLSASAASVALGTEFDEEEEEEFLRESPLFRDSLFLDSHFRAPLAVCCRLPLLPPSSSSSWISPETSLASMLTATW